MKFPVLHWALDKDSVDAYGRMIPRSRNSLRQSRYCHFSVLLVTESALLQCTSLTFYSSISRLSRIFQRLHSASVEKKEATSKRAKARWHLALEKVTMGGLSVYDGVQRVSARYCTLWRWRSMASAALPQGSKRTLPLVLRRGWRPSADMIHNWHKTRPEFFWSHPVSFTLEGIPSQVSEKEIISCIAEFLENKGVGDIYTIEDALASFALMRIGASPFSESYEVGLVFRTYEAAAAVLMGANGSHGIQIAYRESIPSIQNRILQTKAAYKEARAMETVRFYRIDYAHCCHFCWSF